MTEVIQPSSEDRFRRPGAAIHLLFSALFNRKETLSVRIEGSSTLIPSNFLQLVPDDSQNWMDNEPCSLLQALGSKILTMPASIDFFAFSDFPLQVSNIVRGGRCGFKRVNGDSNNDDTGDISLT